MSEKAGRSVLIIDDSDLVRSELRRILEAQGLFSEFLEAQSGLAAISLLKQRPVDLILCDLLMPQVDGFKFLGMLRDRRDAGEIPVIMLTGQEDPNTKIRGFRAGASDYLTKPFHEAELVARVRVHLKLKQLKDELRATNARLEAESSIDPLTKLRTKAHMVEGFALEFLRSQRHGLDLALVCVGLDALEVIDREHGQFVHDEAVAWAAKLLRGAVREYDIVTVWGTGRFGIVLPHTDTRGANALVARLQKTLAAHPLRARKGELTIGACFGLAVFPSAGVMSANDLCRRAEQALERALEAGS